MKEIIAIVGSYDENARNVLHKELEGFKLIEIERAEDFSQMVDAKYVILRTLSIDKDTIAKMPRLKLIQRWGVGYNTVDIEAAGKAGVLVAITSGVNAVPVAEYTLLLMLGVYRNLTVIHNNVRSGRWKDDSLVNRSYVIAGKTVGLIGLGAIGREVAGKVQGLGAQVIYYDSFRLPEAAEAELKITYSDLEQLMETADIISLHLPLNEHTKGLIGKSLLARMKPTSILINTARGGIINEDALYDVLRRRTILGAGLDVFEQEPIAPGNRLLELDNVVVSAHCAGNTADNSINMAYHCVDNIKRVSGGLSLPQKDLVNMHYLCQEKVC